MASAYLKHYGMPRRSGRYPWGSGEDPQRSKSFRQEVHELKKKGLTEKEIADGFKISTTQLRAKISLEKAAQRKADTAEALRLKDKGYSNVEIGKRMGGINESSVRNLLDPAMAEKAAITEATAEMLRKQVEQKKYLDVGAGIEYQLGVSRTKLNTAIAELEEQGTHRIHYLRTEQLGTGKQTSLKVLTSIDTDPKEVFRNRFNIRPISDWSDDGGRSYLGLEPITSVDSKRVKVRFKEDGGEEMDGVIQLRRGVKDLSLGEKRYAQVRIGIDGTHYAKGMAIYSDKMPDGIDIIVNTNKSSDLGKLGALKKIKDDPDNPFGATVRQKHYVDEDGNKKLSALNIVGFPTKPESGEEGGWGTWSKTLSSQFLSKQSPSLAKQQLDITFQIQKHEFDEIISITNPAVKQRLINSFADDCDSKAVHLKAAALPRQSSKVIIPVTSLKENECYTTAYKDGERLALIRHPHGGIFEIPIVTVNNKNREGKSILEDSQDSIGIHPKTAAKLSGADFDGDTVIAIPHSGQIKVSDSLEALKHFDPKTAYPKYEGMPVITAKNKQTEMGKVSNLITDMTLKGASQDEIARAVKHSMVVIDAEKHELNYKQSYIDNGIAALKVRYQGGTLSQPKGAATLISKASSEIRVPARRPITQKDMEENPSLRGLVRRNEYSVDPVTGRKVFIETGETYTKRILTKSGIEKIKTLPKLVSTTRMYETDDAHTLSSGTAMEKVYGDYANRMKRLGDQARLESTKIKPIQSSASAKATYAKEVSALKSKLVLASSNKPLERQAQLLANSIIRMKKADNPNLTASEVKKLKGQALEEARLRTGARKQRIEITEKEWEAIQAGAISHNLLTQILNNTNLDTAKQLAMPRQSVGMSPAKEQKAKLLLTNGYSIAEIAENLGVSTKLIEAISKGG